MTATTQDGNRYKQVEKVRSIQLREHSNYDKNAAQEFEH